MSDGERNEYQAELKRRAAAEEELAYYESQLNDREPSDALDNWRWQADHPERLSDWVADREACGLPLRDYADDEFEPPQPRIEAIIWLVCKGGRHSEHDSRRVGRVQGHLTWDSTANGQKMFWQVGGNDRPVIDGKPLTDFQAKIFSDAHALAELKLGGESLINHEGERLLDRFMMNDGNIAYRFTCPECALDLRLTRPNRPWNAEPFNRWIEAAKPLANMRADGVPQWEAPVRILERQNRRP